MLMMMLMKKRRGRGGRGGEKKVVDYMKEISDSGSSDDHVLRAFST